MTAILYKEYRIEIRPLPIPGGWSAQVYVWNFQSGTSRMIALSLPTHVAFATVEGVHAYAEKAARQWVDRQLPEASRPPQAQHWPLARPRGK